MRTRCRFLGILLLSTWPPLSLPLLAAQDAAHPVPPVSSPGDPAPREIPPWEPAAQHAVTADLYTEEIPLGQTLEPQKALVSRITFGTPARKMLGAPRSDGWQSQGPGAARYLLRLPWTLHGLPETRRVQALWLRVDLGHPEATVVDLFPREVLEEGRQPESLALTGGGEMLPRRGPAPIRIDHVPAYFEGRGAGHSAAYWKFVGDAGRTVPAGSYNLYMVLEVPDTLRFLDVRYSGEGSTSHFFLGIWHDPRTLSMQPIAMRWVLSAPLEGAS
ncbi:MAG TPA: hypothetical protein VHQ65_09325 [Thermoanaerobaculia bacterium]|nr:hypothetical protein [Thermoanaerobaculia bacterium]